MIRGKRMVLRPVEEADLPLLARWRNDPENRRFFFSPFLVSSSGQEKWYEALLADRSRVVFMMEALDGTTVGTIGLDKIDWRNQHAEIGQLLLDAEHRGFGYAEEGAHLLLRYAFEELNLNRVYCRVFAWNRAVIEWNKFYGFSEEGVLRQVVFAGGQFHDTVILGLLREEWRARQVSTRVPPSMEETSREDEP